MESEVSGSLWVWVLATSVEERGVRKKEWLPRMVPAMIAVSYARTACSNYKAPILPGDSSWMRGFGVAEYLRRHTKHLCFTTSPH